MTIIYINKTEEEFLSKLWPKTIIKDECFLYGDKNVYVSITINNTKYLIHRLSCHLFLGLDLDDNKFQANHKIVCDNKNCWNPNHLYVGTQSQNRKDVFEKGTLTAFGNSNLNRNKTHCIHGHEFTKENTKNIRGERVCIECRKRRRREHYYREKELIAMIIKERNKK